MPILLALVFASHGIQASPPGKNLITTPIDAVEFRPMDPKKPDSIQLAVVEGDLKTGPSAFYLKFKPGFKGPIHNHDADYHAVVIKGSPKHWAAGQEAQAKPLPPGSYWFQPGKEFHGDACPGPDECVVLVVSTGKFTFGLPPKTN
jgi:quercetin dioxygenase-like cupin family protein